MLKEANESAQTFEEKLSKLEETKEDSEAEIFEGLSWRQPKGSVHPIEIGKAAYLGLNSSFTAMCWVRNKHESLGKFDEDRQPIFFGDIDPAEQGKG